ncbi:hypothetical protein VKT23_009736 [Stygiomarasmius scandens]|uniref:FAD-binding domain-containing protein n=1 Tax=Marasmiellus scandens TaxID=2682957 RepID=A0ABR1JDU8_9AGAR
MSSFEFATQAKHTLVFTVIGGSIGGLTSAYWLKRAGHDVIVVEKYSEETLKDHKFSGLRSPPNLSRLLSLLPGMEKVLEDKASLNLGAVFHQADTSEPIGQVIWKEEMVADLGSKYYRIPYSDMWNHLYGLCIRENVRFKFNIEVQNITLSKSRLPTVIAVSGEQISCDIVIGADGHNSVTRNCILADVTGNDQGDEDSDRDTSSESSKFPELSEWSSCRLSIPIREMQKDPDLLPLTQNSLWYLWMGDGIFHTGGREGQDQYAVAVFYPFSNFGKKDGEWTMQETSSMTSGEIRETGCDLKVKKLLELASSCQRTTQTPYRLSQFTDSSNQIILIGDAAHGAVINGPQNT